jgi:hypothetical protein
LCNFFKFISIIDDENNRRKNSTFQIFRIVDKNVFLDENGIPPKSNTICNGSTIGFSANIGINYKWISQIIKNHDGFEIPTNFVGNEEFFNDQKRNFAELAGLSASESSTCVSSIDGFGPASVSESQVNLRAKFALIASGELDASLSSLAGNLPPIRKDENA